MMVNYNLENKVVIITGASSGIGAACAVAFASEGAKVALTGRDEAALTETLKTCLDKGASLENLLTLVGDLCNEADCKRVVDEAVKHFGALDVLVNSAGILISGGIEIVSLEQFDRQMNINTRSVYHMMQLALPHLLASKGSIVNVSSVNGLRAFSNVVAYNTSKAAVDQITRCVALEVAGRGVRVNAVNPGVIVTEVHKRAGMDSEQYAKFLEHSKTTHAMGRVGQAHEVADAVLFLASDRSSFITGTTLPVDGGRHAMCPR